jgi:peptidoglycan biosynthesis protein MviN/MurJ (putative lipid II flippase)
MQGSGWQAFVDHLANAERKDARRRRQEFVGRVLYVVIFSALITLLVGLWFQAMGWL